MQPCFLDLELFAVVDMLYGDLPIPVAEIIFLLINCFPKMQVVLMKIHMLHDETSVKNVVKWKTVTKGALLNCTC